VLGKAKTLTVEEWFQEGHGIIGGEKDHNGVWMPRHAPNGKAYIWTPPPVIAVVALKEAMKAIHKRTDAYHIFLIPRLCSPLWMRMLYKVSDVVLKIPAGSRHWPSNMHEPLLIGISLPLLTRNPWTLRGTPLLVGVERELHQVLCSSEEDGGDLLRKLLRTPRQLASVSERVARFKHDKRTHRINHGVQGAHASISFQCETCWIINLEGRLPMPGADDAFLMLIRRANLDAMGGRALSTIEAHTAAIKRWAQNCKLFGMTPPIPPRGPMPMEDQVGMAVAVSLLFNSLTAKPRLSGESHIQFYSMRRPRATHTSA